MAETKPNACWRARCLLPDAVAELEHDLGLSHLTARLLVARGVAGGDEAEDFLAKRLGDLTPPETLRDMDRAAARFARAIEERQRILVHGDYDVDGSTATALLARFCRACSHELTPWIPHRRIDGYGLGPASLEAVREHRSELMITVDCGIADHGWAAEIEAATGCDVIVTDHHLPAGELPRCHAVCNPNRPDCDSPFKGLAGVGVAWKLCWATAKVLCGSDRISQRLREFLLDALALVGVGTVADCVPLCDENRILVHHGLKALGRTRDPGLAALLREARCEDPITTADVGWRIGPLLNASGRLGSAMRNVELLLCDDDDRAAELVAAIVAENVERRRLSQMLTDDLMHEIEEHRDRYAGRAGLVFAGDGWHQGVVGIVASRIGERYARPVAVIAIQDGVGKGSLRSVPGIHLGEAIDRCRSLLQGGGGHAAAAGIAIDPARIPEFDEAFDAEIRRQLPGGLPEPSIEHDGEAAVGELDEHFFADLDRIGPFGIGNPEPVVRLPRASFVGRPRLFGRDGSHLKGAITDRGGGMRELLAWRARERYDDFATHGAAFDVLVRPERSYWRGNAQHRLVLVDSRTAGG